MCRVLWLSCLSIFISLFFLLWALYNTLYTNYQDGLILSHNIDDGLLCFPFTICCCGLISLLALHSNSLLPYSHLISYSILFAYSLTVIIFLFAAICLHSVPLHRSYLIISMFLWGSYGIFFYKEMNSYCRAKVIELSHPLLKGEEEPC